MSPVCSNCACVLLSMCPLLRSPVDEEGVHASFNQLIAEQSQNGGLSDALELQQVQRELDEEGRGTVCLRDTGLDVEG